MDGLLSNLDVSMRKQLVKVIESYPCLLGDTPSRTHILEHDINVGEINPLSRGFIAFTQRSASFLMLRLSIC